MLVRRCHTFITWFNVACGEGVVEKDRGIEDQVALTGTEATAGRRASDGMRYLRIGADMTDASRDCVDWMAGDGNCT